MPPPELWAGALSLLLIHDESGCPHSALNAARLLDHLCDSPDIDDDTRALCERASSRLTAGLRSSAALRHFAGRPAWPAEPRAISNTSPSPVSRLPARSFHVPTAI